MATVPMDERKVAHCRELAAHIAEDVQSYIDRHTSVGVERTILRARYGLDGDEQSLRDIGERIGLSGERVRQIENRALGKLRAATNRSAETGEA